MTIFTRRPTFVAACGAAALLAACASPGDSEIVSRAHQAVESAAAAPEVRQHAAVEIDQARETVRRARNASSDAEAEHLAYVAAQRAQIARERAAARANLAQVEQLGERRGQVVTDAERRRAMEAQQRATTAQQQAEAARRAAQQQQAENERLRRQLSELQTTETDRGLVVTLGDVLFDVDRAELKPGARRQIAKVADALKVNPNSMVRIEGHTDSTGSAEYNLRLSQQRAEAIRRAFIAEGIDASRIEAEGLGQNYPVASNETPAGRQQNRRVDILIQSAEAPAR